MTQKKDQSASELNLPNDVQDLLAEIDWDNLEQIYLEDEGQAVPMQDPSSRFDPQRMLRRSWLMTWSNPSPPTATERPRESPKPHQIPPHNTSPKDTQALSDSPSASQALSRITSDRTTATTTVDL